MFTSNYRVKTLAGISGLLMVTIALSGCAQKMTSLPALEEAKATYQKAQAHPAVIRNAPLELQKAERALNKAELVSIRKLWMDTVQFSYGKRAIFPKVKEIKHLRGDVTVYAAPFRRIAEGDSLWLPEGRGPGMARVTSKRAD